MASYKLLYLGYISDDITTSVEMFSYGILKELNKLDIDLKIFNLTHYNLPDTSNSSDIEKCVNDIKEIGEIDFVLCHIYHSEVSLKIYKILKEMTKYDVTVLIETPICGWAFDKYFLYFEQNGYSIYKNKYKVYNSPILKEFYSKIEKEKKSILLDHRWQGHLGTYMEKSNEIIEWIEELSNEYKIYKLVRRDEKQSIQNWITPIYHSTFQDYLKKISDKEIFISTHYGSYNSTVIDMLGFGAKCIIPKIQDKTFIPQYNIDLFNLPIFSTKNELLDEIKKPFDYNLLNSQIDKCTDIGDIIRDINEQFKQKIRK
jgi:hypothetical protein